MKFPLWIRSLLLALASMAVASRGLVADVIDGSFGIGGFSATVTEMGIDFQCTPGLSNASCPAPADTGNFLVDAGTGNLVPYVGEGGYVGDFNELFTPLNTPILASNWLTFSSAPGNPVLPPTLALDLTFISLGTDSQADCSLPAAVSQTCTPVIPGLVGSPNDPTGLSSFNLQNTASGFTASFSVKGIARNLTGGPSTNFTGTFTATVDGETYQTALSQIFSGTAPPFTYTASFYMATPEPNYVPLFVGLAMLAALAVIYRRRLPLRKH
jgi:hypothetical protein